MATHFEIFDKLREFGRSLDNSSRALPKVTDDDGEDINKARACLQLRAMLSEAKSFKENIIQTVNNRKENGSFDNFLTLCEKHTEKLKEDIENLENHLAKYGYQKESEKLPSVSLVSGFEDLDNHDSSSGLESSCGSPQHNSDKENQPSCDSCEESVLTNEKDIVNKGDLPATTVVLEEQDLFMTPVRPVTKTKWIDDPTSYLSIQENTPSLDTEPLPPDTTRSLLPPRENFMQSVDLTTTPDTSSELPTQPVTKTPLIKPFGHNTLTPEPENTELLVMDFPTPPVYRTPGLQRYGSKQDGGMPVMEQVIGIETPSPPSLTSVHTLNPDDISDALNGKTTSDCPVFQLSPSPAKGALRTINREALLQLPEYLQRKFTLEEVNHLIGKTNDFLSNKAGVNKEYVSDDELVSVLDLGPNWTKVFVLLMVKLNYFKAVRQGYYQVLC